MFVQSGQGLLVLFLSLAARDLFCKKNQSKIRTDVWSFLCEEV